MRIPRTERASGGHASANGEHYPDKALDHNSLPLRRMVAQAENLRMTDSCARVAFAAALAVIVAVLAAVPAVAQITLKVVEFEVADAEATEGDDATLDFVVKLIKPVRSAVTVDYATSDGTATAGSDYTSTSGTLTFAAGRYVSRERTVSVSITDDTVEDDGETFTFTLSNASGFSNPVADVTATGTINNTETETPTNVAPTGAPAIAMTELIVGRLITVSTSGISDGNGMDDATFKWQWIRGSVDIAGATKKTYKLVDADVGERMKVRVSFTDDDGFSESLTSAATDEVSAAADPLTASFEGLPAEHDGSQFSFQLEFSEHIKMSYRTLRDNAFTISGGRITRAKRNNPQAANRNKSWTIRVRPAGNGDISLSLPVPSSCSTTGAVCTHDGRKLSSAVSATVAGPVGLSVADAEVVEGANAVLAFGVSLTRAASSALTVDYATSDGTATAGSDYTSTSGTLTIDAGSSSGTIEVPVLDDEHNEGSETFTLTLSNASSGTLTDASATGTITNHDALPAALVARFGRTAAVHVVDQVEERVNAPRAPGFDGRVAGRQIKQDMGRDFALDFLQQLGGGYGHQQGQPGRQMTAAGANDPRFGNSGRTSSLGPQNGIRGAMNPSASMQGLHPVGSYDHGMGMGLGSDRLLQGSSFALNRATSSGGILSFWSRSAQSQFYGQDGALALNGDVRTSMFGADYAKGRMVTGVSLSHSRGLGRYAGVDSGQVNSAVTGLYPWIGYKASERVTVWTVAGYGAGGLMLNPGAGAPIETGLSMAMAAGGGRGQILGGGEGFGLAFKADTLWVGMRTKAATGPGGNLDSTNAAVSRLRTALEGSQSMTIASRMALTPSVEIGIRQDGGDAETGRGMDLGAGLVLADGVTGLAVDIRVRRLLVHQAEGFAESGMSISVSYNPTPSTPLGFTARVSPAWGGDAMSGAEALWGRESMAGMGNDPLMNGGGQRLDTEVGYGLPIGSRFVGTPRAGVRTSEYGRDYRIGYGMQVLEQGRLNLQLGVDAERRESPIFHLQEQSRGTDQRVLGRATVQW